MTSGYQCQRQGEKMLTSEHECQWKGENMLTSEHECQRQGENMLTSEHCQFHCVSDRGHHKGDQENPC